MRTMASDIKSVQETGGGAPRPYVPPQMPSSLQGGRVGGMTPPSQPPVPPQGGKPPAPAPAPVPGPVGGAVKKPARGGSRKGIFTLIISFIIVVGAGVVGYFFVFPLFSGSNVPPPAGITPPPTTPEPAPASEEESGLFEIPQGDIGAPAAGETGAPPPPSAPPTPSTPSFAHTSYLSIPSDMTSNVVVEDVTASALRQAVGFKTAQVASLKELVLTRDGSSLQLADLGAGLLPQFFTDEIINLFKEDFTYAVYTDAKGSWPVYVFRLSSTADADSARSKFAAIEQASAGALGNLYLSSPGGASTWKDGQVLGTPGRYIAFTASGASLNYVWIENFVVVGTNYTATQEVVKRLGS